VTLPDGVDPGLPRSPRRPAPRGRLRADGAVARPRTTGTATKPALGDGGVAGRAARRSARHEQRRADYFRSRRPLLGGRSSSGASLTPTLTWAVALTGWTFDPAAFLLMRPRVPLPPGGDAREPRHAGDSGAGWCSGSG
jgi:hypothetical protein